MDKINYFSTENESNRIVSDSAQIHPRTEAQTFVRKDEKKNVYVSMGTSLMNSIIVALELFEQCVRRKLVRASVHVNVKVWFTVTVALMTSQEFKVGRASPSEVEARGERRERKQRRRPLTTPDCCAPLCAESCRSKLQRLPA